eukprot:g4659.t1
MVLEAALPRFDQFLEAFQNAADPERIYNATEPCARGQRLKAGGDFPGLSRHAPVHNAAEFEWVPEVEAATPVIKQELKQYVAALAGQQGQGQGHEQERALEGGGEEEGWSTDFFGGSYGAAFDGVALVRRGAATAAAAAFPRTVALLRRHGGPGGGLLGAHRLVFFARQRAGSGVPPHSDCCNYVYTAHLGVHVPAAPPAAAAAAAAGFGGVADAAARGHGGGCGMNVAGREVRWRDGCVSVFQNAYPHHTWNDLAEDRVVLYFDFWHPELSGEERRALRLFADARRRWDAEQQGPPTPLPPPWQ